MLDFSFRVIEEFLKIQETTFDVCINQLKGDMKERYENLAIFNEDVNIMPKVKINFFIIFLRSKRFFYNFNR